MCMKVNDLVICQNKHRDIVFRIDKVEKGIATLRGEVIRLICEVPLDELKPYSREAAELLSLPQLNTFRFQRNEVLKGKVLHIDGDEHYLKKAIAAYKQYGIPAVGYYIRENEMARNLPGLLKKHQPNILIVTGHDALELNSQNKNDLNSYRNSIHFVRCVEIAREHQPDKDSLVVVAGACQSYYEALINSGANFASSPSRENIHLLDPVIIATQVAITHVNDFIEVEKILESTISHNLGGIDTRGSARRIFKGGS